MNVFFKPEEPLAVIGDVIPFFHDGQFHLFYIKDNRDLNTYGYAMSWFQVVSRDFSDFKAWGEAIVHGAINEQDFKVFTGSVFEHEGVFHIFYTGHNNFFIAEGKAQQVILHAVSDDLRNWRKDHAFALPAPLNAGYEMHDWRDPLVFRHPKSGRFVMLITGRKQQGLEQHRGVIVRAESDDLIHWEIMGDFLAPDEFHTHECPDIFQMGEWWYLWYSTYSDKVVTHYRMARSPEGPWVAPADDQLDTRCWYAAKTAANAEGRRFGFGWMPTRLPCSYGNPNQGNWCWGGHLVVHEVIQRSDGTLGVALPEGVGKRFDKPELLSPECVFGQWEEAGDGWTCDSRGQFSYLRLGALPECALIRCRIQLTDGVGNAGVMLRESGNLAHYHLVRLEYANGRLTTDFWERRRDKPIAQERPLPSLAAGKVVELTMVLDGNCLVVYTDDKVALSTRIYSPSPGSWGIFVADDVAHFSVSMASSSSSSGKK